MPPRMSSARIDAARGAGTPPSSYREAARSRSSAIPLIMRLRRAADVREDDHVVLRAQVALARASGRRSRCTARRNNPARRAPSLHPACASTSARTRCAGSSTRASSPPARSPTAHADRPMSRIDGSSARAIGVRDDEGAGAELAAVQLEIVLGDQHADVRVLVAEADQVVVGGVLDHQRRARALDAAGAPSRPR